jgi:hypothetical protein
MMYPFRNGNIDGQYYTCSYMYCTMYNTCVAMLTYMYTECNEFCLIMVYLFLYRLYDIPSSELMKHWDKTYAFIKEAK